MPRVWGEKPHIAQRAMRQLKAAPCERSDAERTFCFCKTGERSSPLQNITVWDVGDAVPYNITFLGGIFSQRADDIRPYGIKQNH